MTHPSYAVSPASVAAFLRDGHVLLRGLVPTDTLPGYVSSTPGTGSGEEDLSAAAAALLGVAAVHVVERRLEWTRPRTPIGPWQRDADRLGGDHPLLTLWLPLQDTSVDLGTPQFASGTVTRAASDQFLEGADDDARPHPIDSRYVVTAVAPMAAGDASFHGGWTAYRMFGNTAATDRLAAVITWAPA